MDKSCDTFPDESTLGHGPLCPSQAADNSARAWSDCLASTGLTRLDIGPGGRVTIPSKKEWHGYLFSVSLDICNNAPESSSSMEFCRHPGGRGFSKSDPYLKGMESYVYHSKPKRALEKVRLTYSLKDTVLFSWANWSGMMRLVWQPWLAPSRVLQWAFHGVHFNHRFTGTVHHYSRKWWITSHTRSKLAPLWEQPSLTTGGPSVIREFCWQRK